MDAFLNIIYFLNYNNQYKNKSVHKVGEILLKYINQISE